MAALAEPQTPPIVKDTRVSGWRRIRDGDTVRVAAAGKATENSVVKDTVTSSAAVKDT